MAEQVRPAAKRVTTADIARASGVSRATVSYVLNNVEGRQISDSTRETVLATARRLGHIPHGPARSLRLGRSPIVLALVQAYAIGYVADRIVEELDRALTARGFVLMVHRFEQDARPLTELWGLVAPELIVSMAGLRLDDLTDLPPSVKLERIQGVFPHGRAGRMQVEYLHSKGHRRLGYAHVDNPLVELIAAERRDGAEKARAELGLPPFVEHRFAITDLDSAFAALDDWTSGLDPVTAVCCHNDEIALLLMSAMQTRGLQVNRDLALIGVDNIPLSRASVTTIEINVPLYTEVIVERVLGAIDGQDAQPVQDHEDYLRLIVRDTA